MEIADTWQVRRTVVVTTSGAEFQRDAIGGWWYNTNSPVGWRTQVALTKAWEVHKLRTQEYMEAHAKKMREED